MNFRQTLGIYYRLTKPGIVYGNGIAGAAGYFYGAAGGPSLTVFAALLVGISAVIASAGVLNNVIDRDIDAKMKRTKQRAVASGAVTPQRAVLYAAILLAIGVAVLSAGTNILAVSATLFGYFAYVVLYGIAKRRTVHGTLVGTISGSMPPVIGYVAATGQLDIIAALLFLILLTWQMPHFYAIALFRRDDYAAASIPVLPLVKGEAATRHQSTVYISLFLLSCILFFVYGGTSVFWLLVMLLVGSYWLYLSILPVINADIAGWARRQFGWSLIVLLVFSALLSVDTFLH